MKNYLTIARRYAVQVTTGEIPACQYVQQAGQRFLDDLEGERDAGSAFRMDPGRAARACRFIELLPHVHGHQADQLIELEPWEVFILVNIFGWVMRATGYRRFRKIYVEVPRGNAKSTLSAGIRLYCLAADGEQGAEVYSVDRAGICYEVRGYLIKIFSGVVSDDSVFGLIYTIDEGEKKRIPPVHGDDWKRSEAWARVYAGEEN